MVLTEFSKKRINAMKKNGAIIYKKYYGEAALTEAKHTFFPIGPTDDNIEKNNTASEEWASNWTPSEINNAVYFTYAVIAKDRSHFVKHARFIIGNSDLGESLGVAHKGIRKGRRIRRRKTSTKKRRAIGKKGDRIYGLGKCKKLGTKKYRERNSPSYSAESCHWLTRKGNDGKYYISTQNKSKIYTWKKM